MAEKNKKADIFPVNKDMGRAEPRHLLRPFDNMEKLFEDFFLGRGYASSKLNSHQPIC